MKFWSFANCKHEGKDGYDGHVNEAFGNKYPYN